MRVLIAEDDLSSRKFLSSFLSKYAVCDSVVDGMEAVEAFEAAHKEGKPYNLICLDIMMPKMDGIKTLKAIRDMEGQENIQSQERAKVIMTTALMETPFIHNSFDIGCDAYATKPINLMRFKDLLKKNGFNVG